VVCNAFGVTFDLHELKAGYCAPQAKGDQGGLIQRIKCLSDTACQGSQVSASTAANSPSSLCGSHRTHRPLVRPVRGGPPRVGRGVHDLRSGTVPPDCRGAFLYGLIARAGDPQALQPSGAHRECRRQVHACSLLLPSGSSPVVRCAGSLGSCWLWSCAILASAGLCWNVL
jgi:hypothetical protein